jgi:uncharacterized protein YkwD
MKKQSLFFFALFGLFLALLTPSYAQTKTERQMAEEAFALVNAFRKKKGKPALVWNEEIYKSCLAHSQAMAQGKERFGHGGFSARVAALWETVGSGQAAENVHYHGGDWGKTHAETAVESWIDSPGHNKNMRGEFTHSAIAVAKNKRGNYYFTQIFLNLR